MSKQIRLSMIVGARPNFVKIAALSQAIRKDQNNFSARLIHTGQHWAESLSDSFFTDLDIPKPDMNLEISGGTSAQQIGRMLPALESEFQSHRPDLVVVVGDVNSTLAGALAAKSLQIPIAHIEAGLRSFDLKMPEEINRIMTDSISDYFFTTSKWANQNLVHEGHSADRIFLVGNTMIDTLKKNIERLKKPALWDSKRLEERRYIVLTLHRPSNVDDPARLSEILKILSDRDESIPIVFPVHPRTRAQISKIGDNISSLSYKNLILLDPLPYLEFMYLVKNSMAAITDSGGIQEETTWLKVPCLTLRDSTERPETVSVGTNEILGLSLSILPTKLKQLISGEWKCGDVPELWDGRASERILEVLKNTALKFLL